ncbi:hypothetical protein A9W95_18230 [Mycobacterium sp. 1423905.2]|nr:hypothetical protein A9W95_18230 [Mycobacterium sp. 1423905.2]
MTLVWFLCTGIGSTVPLFFLAMHDHPGLGAVAHMFNNKFLMKGELLLIAIVLIAASFGDLIYAWTEGKVKGRRIGAIILGQAIVFACAVVEYFSATSPDGDATWGEKNAGSVAGMSFLLGSLAIVVGWATLMFRSADGRGRTEEAS